MNCILIMIGTELLNGGTLDTNSLFIAEELNKFGIHIDFRITVGDSLEQIIDALKFAKDRTDLIILSGGLGPTDDDLTKLAISKYFNKALIVDDNELIEIKSKFNKANIPFLDKNLREVEKPEGSVSFKNDVGMAPAFFIDGLVAFPGVPRELKNMFPKFLKFYSENYLKNIDGIYIKDIIVLGIAESILEEKIKHFFTEPNITYEFLVKDYGTLIRMQTTSSNKNKVIAIKNKIYGIISDNIIGEDEDRIEQLIFNILKKKNYSFSVAESCTGGMLASTIVSLSGISEFFEEGVVTYSNKSKTKRLGVDPNLFKFYGAVSEEVATEMVKGLSTDIGISTTGIAGPLGGTDEKPIGLVYVGIKIKDKIEVIKFNFNGSREKIRKRTVIYSLFELYKRLITEN